MAPLVQDIIGIPGLREADNLGRPVDLGVDRLGCDELTNVLLRLILVEIEQLGESTHLNAGVVFGNNADVVLNDPFSQILPPLVRLLV